MLDDDTQYKQKYLKYKAKYIEQKYYIQKGGILDYGYSVIFTSKNNANKIREAIKSGNINAKEDIANLFDKQAYIIFDGKNYAELLVSNAKIVNDHVNNISNVLNQNPIVAYY